MTDNIDVVVKESGTSAVVTSFDNLSASAKRAHTSVSALQKLFGNVGRSTAAATRVTALGTAAQGTAGHVNNLNSAMTALNNTRVTANLNSANQALGQTGTQASRAATGVRDLLAAFLSFHAIRTVISTLVEAQVGMQQIHYGLLAATGSAEGANEQFEFLKQNARTLGVDLKNSAQEFTRLAASANAMNVSMEDQQKLYTALSQASTVLHLDSQKMQFATLALTQMFSKGKIQAEELRRQLGEAIPGANVRFQKAVMEVVKGTNLAKYSFEELMKRGLLDTAKFLPQLIQALGEVGSSWQEASKSLHSEITRLRNEWWQLTVDVSSGLFSTAMLASVKFLRENLQALTGVIIGLGVAISVALAPAAIIKFIAYVKMLGVAVWAAAGPWGLLIGAIAGVIGGLVSMRDEIKLTSDSHATLGDMMAATWDTAKVHLNEFWEQVKYVGGFLWEELGYGMSVWLTGSKNGFDQYKTYFASSVADITESNDSTWLKIVKVVARAIDSIIWLLKGLFNASQRIFLAIAGLVTTTFGNAVEQVKALFTGDFDKVLELGKENLNAAKLSGKMIMDSFNDGMMEEALIVSENGAEAFINNMQKEAIKRSIKVNLLEPPGAPQTATGTPPGGGKASKEIEKLGRELENLLGKLDPTQAALKELAQAERILNAVLLKGTPAMKAAVAALGGKEAIMARLAEKYRDVLKPVEALSEKYDRELQSIRAITPEQKALVASQEAMNKARKDGYDAAIQSALGEETYRRELEKTQAQLLASAEAQVYQNSAKEKARKLQAEIQGLINQRNAGNIGDGEFASGMKNAVGIDPSIFDQYKAQEELYSAHLAVMQEMRNEYLASAKELEGQAQIDAIANAQASAEVIRQIEMQKVQNTLQFASSILGQVSTLMSSHNKRLFKIGQGAAIAQAAVDTASAVLKAGAQWGYPWAIPFQAIAIATGAAQISQIRSQQPPGFRTGGSFVVGGSGGPDSQLAQFNVTPGEHIQINTPAQARALEKMADDEGERRSNKRPINMSLTVVQTGKPDNNTPRQNAREMRRGAQKMMRVKRV